MSSRGISRPTTTTIVPVKTPSNQLNPSDSQFGSALQRWQNGVEDTINSVLMWLNSHFGVAPPTVSNNGRSVAPDLTTLVSADTGCAIESAYPLTVQIPTSALTASMSNVVITTIAVPTGWELVSIYVSAPVPSAGSGTISAQANTAMGWQGVPVSGASGLVLTNGVTSVPIGATSSIATLSLYANTSSSWAVPAGTVYVTLYVAQGVG